MRSTQTPSLSSRKRSQIALFCRTTVLLLFLTLTLASTFVSAQTSAGRDGGSGSREITTFLDTTAEALSSVITDESCNCLLLYRRGPALLIAPRPIKPKPIKDGRNQRHIPEPKCKPWQTVMWEYTPGEEPTRKWCETDGNVGYPLALDVVRAYLPYWGKPRSFQQSHWQIDIQPKGSISGDWYSGWADIIYRNVNKIEPYRSEYRYQMTVNLGVGSEVLKISMQRTDK